MERIVDDALGSVSLEGGKLALLDGSPEATGRFVFACSQIPRCLDLFDPQERVAVARFLLGAEFSPDVALALKGLSDSGMASLVVTHKLGASRATVKATSLAGKALWWGLDADTFVGASKADEHTVIVSERNGLNQIQLEVLVRVNRVSDHMLSAIRVLTFPSPATLVDLRVQLTDEKGQPVAGQSWEKNFVLEVSFKVLSGATAICPDHAAVVLAANGQDLQFPMNCSPETQELHYSITNTLQLSQKLDFSPSVELLFIVSDEKMQQGVQHAFGALTVAPFAKPVKKELPLFAESLLHESDTTQKALPEIHHQFREPDRRAPKLFAFIFSGVQLVWLMGLLGGLYYFGFHVLKVFTSWRVLFFALALGLIEVVLVWFWLGVGGAPNTEMLVYKYLPPLLIVITLASRTAMTGGTKKTSGKLSASM
jgi:hypothetical protein